MIVRLRFERYRLNLSPTLTRLTLSTNFTRYLRTFENYTEYIEYPDTYNTKESLVILFDVKTSIFRFIIELQSGLSYSYSKNLKIICLNTLKSATEGGGRVIKVAARPQWDYKLYYIMYYILPFKLV